MTDAQTILRMIETVDPSDTGKLDEIDWRFWLYARGYSWGNILPSWPVFDVPQYTRSRDALKAIRPVGWYFIGGMVGGYADMKATKFMPGSPEFTGHQFDLKTEELAELHAIIQAIAYERGEN